MSQSAVEQQHIVDALTFELTKVDVPYVRERVVRLLANVDSQLAQRVAANLDIEVSTDLSYLKASTAPLPNDRRGAAAPGNSPALSMANTVKNSIATRKIALLAMDGYDAASLEAVKAALIGAGATTEMVSAKLGELHSSDNQTVAVDKTLTTAGSVLYDAVFVAAGSASVDALASDGLAIHFVKEAFKHFKPIGALGDGIKLLRGCGSAAEAFAGPNDKLRLGDDNGVVTAGSNTDMRKFNKSFIAAIAQHRHWQREVSGLDA